jgi:signal transduction histidine kinase/HAMP domain-containing protein
MLKPFLTSLRFQVALAFAALIVVFAAASLYALAAFERQIDHDAVVDIAARLELTASQMHMQAMNYKANAPRDYPTYYRDVRLYYRDLSSQIALFDGVVAGFMEGDLSEAIGGPAGWMKPDSTPELREAILQMEERWSTHRRGLLDALGDDPDEPRLEWAAEYNIAQYAPLQEASSALTQTLRARAQEEHERIEVIALALIAGTVALALAILAALHFLTLKPMQRTIAGFQRVAEGDFGHELPIAGSTEIAELTARFNALSGRLNLLFQLIERLQRGKDLDDVVGFLGAEFRELLRFDWIGVVLVNPDAATVRLEASALDGRREHGCKQLFRLQETLIDEALARGEPMHIADVAAIAAATPRYEFLRDIVRRGLNDVIFLPVASQSPVPALVAFATRASRQYDSAHLHFLGNIAQLISESFGRTVRLAERGRLAAIGELASGIAHEMRSPLATLTLALDYFDRREQEPGARKRLDLALAESARMARLVEDMLLYAKPLKLDLARLDLAEVVTDAVSLVRGQSCCADKCVSIDAPEADRPILGDRDRLLQVMTNLVRNACEAAEAGGTVRIRLETSGMQSATVAIHNGGAVMSAALLARAFQPFVSTKQGGTGLGLAIVQRLIGLHGGAVDIESAATIGTTVRVTLPLESTQVIPLVASSATEKTQETDGAVRPPDVAAAPAEDESEQGQAHTRGTPDNHPRDERAS